MIPYVLDIGSSLRSWEHAGLDGLSLRLNSVKAFLQQQISGVAAKQDETLAAQAQMKAELGHVAQDVHHTREEVSEVIEISVPRFS